MRTVSSTECWAGYAELPHGVANDREDVVISHAGRTSSHRFARGLRVAPRDGIPDAITSQRRRPLTPWSD